MELNKIYNENNLETMSRMPDEFVDLTITSPPYDDLRDYKGYVFPFQDIAQELFRVTKNGGVVVWVVGDSVIDGSESGTSFRQALYFKDIGFNIHDTMIFEKPARFPESTRYYQCFEYMFVFSKGKPKTINLIADKKNIHLGNSLKSSSERQKDGTFRKSHGGLKGKFVKPTSTRGNIWRYICGNNNSTKDHIAFMHPAIFPEKLAADHIYSWSNEGDLVYDCFGGSGTTAKMAHLQKRNWILSEISSEYVQIAEKRIEPYLSQTLLF